MNETEFEYENLNYTSPYRHVEYNNNNNSKKYILNNNTIDQQIKGNNPITNGKFTKLPFGKNMQSNIYGSIIEEESSNQKLDKTITNVNPKNGMISNSTLINERVYSNNRAEPLTYHDKLPVNSTIRNKIIDLFFNW